MAGEYGALAALKERLTVEASDTSRDDGLNGVLAAASRGIDRACGRRFWLDAEPTTRLYNPSGRVVREADGELLLVDDIGSESGLVVEVGRGASWTPITGYETSPYNAIADGDPITGLLLVNGSWGTAAQRVRVTAQFGWPSVPEDIAEAALIQAARLWKRRDTPEGITGNAEWGVVRLSRRDPDVWNLLEPFVLPGFA